MIKINEKSPIVFVGLFCLLGLWGCQPNTPKEVCATFWTALAENNLSKAQQYSKEALPFVQKNCKEGVQIVEKNLCNAKVQTGKMQINYDEATVETSLNLQTASGQLTFTTYLIRQPQHDEWKVDFQRTQAEITDTTYKNIFLEVKEKTSSVLKKITTKIKLLF